MACVSGRVEFALDLPEHPDFDAVSLVAVARSEAPAEGELAAPLALALGGDGRFSVQLPAGRYDLGVTALERPARDGAGEPGFAGGADDLRVDAGQVIDDVVIAIERTAAIDGALRGMRRIPIAGATVRARRVGAPLAAGATGAAIEATTDQRGRFHLGALRRGDYDLSVEASESHRGRLLRQVAAPSTSLVIDVARRPILLGALPSGRDGVCPPAHLEITGDGETTSIVELQDGCTFATELAAEAGEVRIEGTVGGRAVSMAVMVPSDGDPAPVCLLGPCAAIPAAAVVAVVGRAAAAGGGKNGRALITDLSYAFPASDGDGQGRGASGGGATLRGEDSSLTVFDELPAGRRAQFSAARQGESGEVTAFLSPGVTEVLIELGPR